VKQITVIPPDDAKYRIAQPHGTFLHRKLAEYLSAIG
jgi:hypothetical protein